jgi:hypothetical protein
MQVARKLPPSSSSLQLNVMILVIMYGGIKKVFRFFDHVPHGGNALATLRNATKMAKQARRC